ncbi:small nuclear ribonucleoprotein G [Biomphalaria pfeifferi]|uniref:Small nuclear ribonucleoprotein G n=1 Tax=Biomphalaria pfeifferi TaxID=112525 RepID=A0AAD8FPM4_BIOPF|nr:small nuclear ribonucleoprotein G [Biomphalaria pfeifferi]
MILWLLIVALTFKPELFIVCNLGCRIKLSLWLYMEKVLTLKLNGNRKVTGTLRGFDPFMNLVVDDAVEETKSGEKRNVGMVVIRGNSVVLLESQERI